MQRLGTPMLLCLTLAPAGAVSAGPLYSSTIMESASYDEHVGLFSLESSEVENGGFGGTLPSGEAIHFGFQGIYISAFVLFDGSGYGLFGKAPGNVLLSFLVR